MATSLQSGFTLRRDPWDRLVLTMTDGRMYCGVEPIRAYPISDPEHWISLCDATGHELVCLPSLDGLTPPERQILEDELRWRQFIPVIRRVIKVSTHDDPCQWTVETDRGRTAFLLGGDEDVRHLSTSCVLIVDLHGVRYLIPNLHELDAASRRILDRYI